MSTISRECRGALRRTFLKPRLLHVALLDVAQRENQKHDRRDGKEHYATRTVGFGSTQP